VAQALGFSLNSFKLLPLYKLQPVFSIF